VFICAPPEAGIFCLTRGNVKVVQHSASWVVLQRAPPSCMRVEQTSVSHSSEHLRQARIKPTHQVSKLMASRSLRRKHVCHRCCETCRNNGFDTWFAHSLASKLQQTFNETSRPPKRHLRKFTDSDLITLPATKTPLPKVDSALSKMMKSATSARLQNSTEVKASQMSPPHTDPSRSFRRAFWSSPSKSWFRPTLAKKRSLHSCKTSHKPQPLLLTFACSSAPLFPPPASGPPFRLRNTTFPALASASSCAFNSASA
jgi:hypothetical protein